MSTNPPINPQPAANMQKTTTNPTPAEPTPAWAMEAANEIHKIVYDVAKDFFASWSQEDTAAIIAKHAQRELATLTADKERAEAATKEQFRLYCEETKKHNATAALLAQAKEDFDYAAKALTEHAEAVGISPDHIDYIDLTSKAIIEAWANKTNIEAQLATTQQQLAEAREDAANLSKAILNFQIGASEHLDMDRSFWEERFNREYRLLLQALASHRARHAARKER